MSPKPLMHTYICLKGRTCESTGSSQRELSIGDCLHCATAFPNRLRLCLLPPLPRVGGRNKLAVPKEYASTFQVAFESFWQFMSACASILMLLLLAPVLQFVAVLLPAAWSDAKGATKTLWELLRSIPLSSTICQVALDTLWLLLSACVSGLRFTTALLRMAWPRVQGVPTHLSNFLASVISNVSTEVGAVVIVLIVNLLLLRFFPRGRYPHRARLDGAGASYSELVGRMFHPSHRAFPHVVYWVSAGLFAFLAPEPTAKVWDTFGLFVTATWPSLYALYLAMRLRSEDVPDSADTPGARRTLQRQELTTSPSSADHDHPVHSASVVSPQVDRVLTYWIVFAVVMCCSYVPLASSVAEKVATLSFVGPAAFFLVLWVHLLGPESGLQVTSGSGPWFSIVICRESFRNYILVHVG